MTPVLVLVAVLVAGGGALAVAAREPRVAALGTLVVLVGSPYVADPFPGTLALGARLAGAVLAGYLVWIALRRGPAALPARGIGLPGAAAVAIVAFAAGWLAASTLSTTLATGPGDGPSTGALAAALASGSFVPRAALGAAFALLALAAGPVLLARDLLRMGLGLLLLVAAAGLVANAIGAGAGPAAELAIAVLVALAGAGTAAVVTSGLGIAADLDLRDGPERDRAIRHRPVDEAHRREAG